MLVILLMAGSVMVDANDCFKACLPVTEQDLLDPKERWPFMREVADSVHDALLTELAFVDSSGAVLEDIDVWEVIECDYDFAGAKGITMKVIFIDVDSKEEDQYLYFLSYKGDQIVGRLLAAQLQTSCDNTFLRACSLMPDGSVRLQQIEHLFDCQEDKYIETRTLPSFRVYMLEDGTFNNEVEE